MSSVLKKADKLNLSLSLSLRSEKGLEVQKYIYVSQKYLAHLWLKFA